MRVSVSSPHGYLNWDKFLSSNFVMLSMYGLQLTTTKFLIFVYLDHPFILNTNWSNPSYHIVCYTTRQSSVTNVRLFTQQNTYDQYVYASLRGETEMSFGVRGLRSEFSRPEFTRHLHQTVVFLRFKNDSSSDSSPLIQNKYDSRVFKMRY